MRRYHSIESDRVRRRRKKQIKERNGDYDDSCVNNYNYNKRHIGCKIKQCRICHWDKLSGEIKHKYKIENVKYEWQLQEEFGDIGYKQKEVEEWMKWDLF